MDMKQMLLELPGDIATKKLELLGEQERLIIGAEHASL